MSSEIFVVPRLLVDFPGLPALLQDVCATAAEENRGLTVGQFLSELEDDELGELFEILLQAQNDAPLLMAVSTFCALLGVSEGLVIAEDEDLTPFLTRLGLMTQAEMLSRKKLLSLDPATLTMESFDILAVPRTEEGKRRIAEIKVVRIPPQ